MHRRFRTCKKTENQNKQNQKYPPKQQKNHHHNPKKTDVTLLAQRANAHLNLGEKCVRLFIRLMLCENTLNQNINYFQKTMHIVSISFIYCNIKKHTSFSSLKYNSNCTLTKKINSDIHEHVNNRIHYILLCWYCTWNGSEVRHSKNKVI